EECNDGTAFPSPVRGRGRVVLHDVVDQGCDFRRLIASVLDAILHRTGIDRYRHKKSALFGRSQQGSHRSISRTIAGPVPGNDCAIDASALNVGHLALNLMPIVGSIADVDVLRVTPPEHQSNKY